ncbi:MAG: TraB/GumN family protein [Chitinophagales bacterium]|nr:TraB/GumN family protein [Chitinophagales bacterium]
MPKKSLLWRITPKEGGNPSYLFGTMHVRDLRAFRWLEVAKTHLETCNLFATEFDFLESDPAALAEALKLPEGVDLQQLIGKKAWKCLDFLAQHKLGATAEAFREEHPMSVSSTLSMANLLTETPYSLDETLWHHARANGIRTTGVESFAAQMETIHRIPLESHVKSLVWLVKNESRHKKRMRSMLKWYMSGDIQSLYKAARKDAKGMRHELLFRRNKLMAERFATLANQESLFCAVGAGHLAGGKGMLRLIKKAGFTVSPVGYVTA